MRTVAWFLAAIVLTALLAACGDSEIGLSCTDPAPLTGTPSGASPLYFVSLIEGVDVFSETQRMEAEYGFTASETGEHGPTFFADLTTLQLTQVRCDDAVDGVRYSDIAIPAE